MATKVKKKSRKAVVAAGPATRKRAKPAAKAAATPAPKPARRAPAVRQASRSERSYAMKP
jgi:hypothetical protein